MEVVYSNDDKFPYNDGIIGYYGDLVDLMHIPVNISGVEYDDTWSVRRFLNGYHLTLNKRIPAILNYLELDDDLLNKKIYELSSTNLKYVLLAYLLINNKKFIIFDNFEVGLSYKEQKKIIKIMRNMYKDGIRIVIISHDLVFMDKIVDNVVVINNGDVLYYGTIGELFSMRKKIVDEPNIIKFIKMANRKGAKLSYTLDSKELLKDVYRSVN